MHQVERPDNGGWLFEGKPERKVEEKSPAPGAIQTHDLQFWFGNRSLPPYIVGRLNGYTLAVKAEVVDLFKLPTYDCPRLAGQVKLTSSARKPLLEAL